MRQPVGLLSGGQRQALTLLMATMEPPELLLLDEHTAALDPATAEKVWKLTREIIDGNKITCLMVTHNMHQALELGNRTLMMADGKIVLDVSGEERKGMKVEDLLETVPCRGRPGAGQRQDTSVRMRKIKKGCVVLFWKEAAQSFSVRLRRADPGFVLGVLPVLPGL